MQKKHPSGHAGRQKAKAKAIAELKTAAAALGVSIVDPNEPDPDADYAEQFAAIGPPPLEDPGTAMAWTRRVQLVALHAAIVDKTIPLKDKLRLVKDLTFVAGTSHNRAELEERLAAVENALAGTRQRAGVEVKATNGLIRPPTARGGIRSRGPRAVETPPPGPDNP